MALPAKRQLASGAIATVTVMTADQADSVRSLLNEIIVEGSSYPQSVPLDQAQFTAYWCAGHTFVATVADTVIAAFYLKPNFPGKASHIANAGFIVSPHWRHQGLGQWLGELAIAIAPHYGYTALMFNLVFASNVASLRIWQRLGFTELGRIPNAINHQEDAVILYRSLR